MFPGLLLTVAAMPSKGLWRASLSTETKLDADEDVLKPLKPLLGIAVVGNSCFYYSRNYFKSNKTFSKG
jgi:hypothetical protein